MLIIPELAKGWADAFDKIASGGLNEDQTQRLEGSTTKTP